MDNLEWIDRTKDSDAKGWIFTHHLVGGRHGQYLKGGINIRERQIKAQSFCGDKDVCYFDDLETAKAWLMTVVRLG
jgi:hypothetical protein